MMRPRVHILNQMVAERRRALNMTQDQLSARLGVARTEVARWEGEWSSIPEKHLVGLCEILGWEIAEVRNLHFLPTSGRPALGGLPGLAALDRRLLPYDVKGTLESMLSYGQVARFLHGLVREQLGPLLYADFTRNFPRDSALELLRSHRLLSAGESELRLVRPLTDMSCILPIVERHTDHAAGHRLHYAIWLTDGELQVVAIPQVSLVTRKIVEAARVDFLTRVWDGTTECYIDMEVDGAHETSRERDQQRATGLGLIRQGYTREELLHPSYDERLWRRLREALEWKRSLAA